MTLHPELPQNIEAERATLASLITNRDAIALIAHWCTADLFYLERHGFIYTAIHSLFSRRIPPDLRTLTDELRRRDWLDLVGGLDYLIGLSDELPTSYHVEFYAKEVQRCAVLRKLVTASTQIAAIGYDDSMQTDQAIGDAQQALAAIALNASNTGLVSMSDLIDREYDRLQRAANGETSAIGTRTGFRDLDDLTGGLQDQDLIILAARPSVGKSALMLCMARGIAKIGERDSLIFSLEMSKEQIVQRFEAMDSRVDSSRIRTLQMSEHDTMAFVEALGPLASLPIEIDDTPAINVGYMRSAAYRHQAATNRPLAIFVDYLQLMTAPGYKPDDRVQIVSAISRDLKALAKELRCPVVALSQLSRGVESRQSHIPMLSDLRESGGIEQDADVVLMLYRDEMYNKETEAKGIAELHIAKHRNGPVGVVPLRWDAQTTKFSDLTYRTPEGYDHANNG
jgi:replicative DNA helicase